MSPRFADDAGRYALESRIAAGGMGEVWRGRDTVLDRPVAVKLLRAEFADDALFRTRFETEARHAGSLHHPGIAAVHDFGQSTSQDGSGTPRPFLVMELVDGQPLSALLRPGQPMDPAAASDLLAQAATALGAAHAQGLVHRDVKPANLIVTADRRLKVTDFGIARAAEGMSLTETGQVVGTPSYISPEQAEGRRATPASDVYSLGVVAYECLAGRKPFVGDTPVATAIAHVREPVPPLPAGVPAGLAAVVLRSLAKDPADRFVDGTTFAQALRDPSTVDTAATAVMPRPVEPHAAPVPPPEPAPERRAEPPRERRRSGAGWLVLLAVMALLAVLVAFWLGSGLGTDTSDDSSPGPDRSETPSEIPTESPSESPSETPSETPSESPTPDTVDVDPGDYVGRDVADVESDLSALGLVPSRVEVANPGDERPGTVSEVSPSGSLAVGDAVTVSFWGEPAEGAEQTGPSGEDQQE